MPSQPAASMTDSIYVRKDPNELRWPLLLRKGDDGQLSLVFWVESKDVDVFKLHAAG
jgi:hypothetical protein